LKKNYGQMPIQFDTRGLLMPYERVALTLDEFQKFFVEAFEEDSTRHGIFRNYLRYVDDFRNEITTTFIQWLDGSFLTQKSNPADLDFVTLLDFQISIKKEKQLERRFLNRPAMAEYGLDAYIEQIFPEGHRDYFFTQSDLAYWHSWFSKTKENRAGRRFPKGYVEIRFAA